MKVVCDNCRSAYRVPDSKLQKPINKAVCRSCGYRLMIPRPKPGDDPDKRTLVSAVPPRKAGAPKPSAKPASSPPPPREPPREAPPKPAARPAPPLPPRSFPTSGPLIDPETMPIGDIPEPLESMRPDLPSAATPDSPTAVRSPSHPSIPSRAPVPSMPSVPRTPPPSRPAPRSPSQPSIPMRRAPPSRPHVRNPTGGELPTRAAGPRSVSAAAREVEPFDPSMDYAWTLVGLGVAGVGVLLSVVSLFVDHPVVVFAGSGMLVGGLLLSLLITISGRRGRRRARVFSSLATSGTVGGLVAFTIVSVRFALDSGHIWARTAPPLPPPTPAAEAETPESTNPAGIPVEAVRPLVENNLAVKGCFVPMFLDNVLPPRVDVSFTISPEGRASEIRVHSPERFVGTKLETCLVEAIGGIVFPKSTGQGTSFVYPLVLR